VWPMASRIVSQILLVITGVRTLKCILASRERAASSRAAAAGVQRKAPMPRRRHAFGVLAVLALVGAVWFGPRVQVASSELPHELSDRTFWTLINELSEPGGSFRSDNLVSNETAFQHVIPTLRAQTKPGGVYLGVGPDQNFTYIAALHPRMAFIVDIRRQNLLLHLMYKALIEMSDDRADFLARLFSRTRPRNLSNATSAEELFTAFADVAPTEANYRNNLDAMMDR